MPQWLQPLVSLGVNNEAGLNPPTRLASGWNWADETGTVDDVGKEDREAVKRFLVYSAAVPSEPLLPLGDMQAGLIRFSFCRLKSKEIYWSRDTLQYNIITLQTVINFVNVEKQFNSITYYKTKREPLLFPYKGCLQSCVFHRMWV